MFGCYVVPVPQTHCAMRDLWFTRFGSSRDGAPVVVEKDLLGWLGLALGDSGLADVSELGQPL